MKTKSTYDDLLNAVYNQKINEQLKKSKIFDEINPFKNREKTDTTNKIRNMKSTYIIYKTRLGVNNKILKVLIYSNKQK